MFNRRNAWAAAASLCITLQTLTASDHLDAPALTGKGGQDINDVYAFQSPTSPDKSVLVLTVNPFAGNLSPTTFDPNVGHEFLIDNNGDALPDLTFTTTFSAPNSSGTQSFSMKRQDGSVFAEGSTETNVAAPGGTTIRAGLFDDPFFFDLTGFRNGFNFTGTDFFKGANTSAIVLEVPSSLLGGPNIGIWTRTTNGGVQVDRKGRPAINTALIPSGMKDAFNLGMPSTDFTNFGDEATASILSLNGGDATHAANLAAVLLPDILTFNTASSDGFLNGRKLGDDVIDAELNLLSKGGVTGDGVNSNDREFLNVFPYLASPNPIPEPSSMLLLSMAVGGMCWLKRMRRSC